MDNYPLSIFHFPMMFPNGESMKSILVCLIAMFLFAGFVHAQANSAKYVGSPETDKTFASFVTKNLGRVVYLKLTIQDTQMVTMGYKGVQPYFEGAKANGIFYSYFLECSGKISENQNPIDQCKDANWNEGTGVLSGYFKVSRIVKTKMRNSRAVFLVPVKRK